MPASIRSRNVYYPLTAICSGLFIVTIMALVAALFGEPQAPAAKLLDWCGGWLLGVEVAGILLSGFMALAVDRGQTLAATSESIDPLSHSTGLHEQPHPGGD